MVLLEVATADEAFTAAERSRQLIEQFSFSRKDEPLKMTVSIGIGVIVPADKGLDDLLRRADKALYAAKAKGRNCVELN